MDIYVIPDTQLKADVKNPLIAVAHHICSLYPKPELIIHMGDHWDFPSLSSYDKGKKSHEAKTYLEDVEAGNSAMDEFWAIISRKWPEFRLNAVWIFLNGNHEFRRNRAMEYGSNDLRDLMTRFPLKLHNWREYEFLKVIKIHGVNFSHYFQNLNSPKAITSARLILMKKHSSCIAAHMQGFDYAEQLTDQGIIQAVIAGSCYYHNEEYKPQSNHHWRGTLLLKDVKDGRFEFNRYSLKNLEGLYDYQ